MSSLLRRDDIGEWSGRQLAITCRAHSSVTQASQRTKPIGGAGELSAPREQRFSRHSSHATGHT